MRIVLPVDETLTLKQFAEEDADAIFALIDNNRAHISSGGDSTPERYPTKQALIDGIRDPPDQRKLNFGIWTPEMIVGSAYLYLGSDGWSEIGCYLGKHFEGQGYATRALRRLVDYAFETDTRVVWTKLFEGNRSQKILERLGNFRYSHSLRLTSGQNLLTFTRER